MKLLELLKNQKLNVELQWDKNKIEFSAVVIECDESAVYITPYIHNGNALELNITCDTKVVCNLYANDTITNKRVTWKGIELTTVNRNDNTVYCIKHHGFNDASYDEDRRTHERINVQIEANILDEKGTENVTIHDISDNGLGVYAPKDFLPSSRQLTIDFTDNIGEKTYNFRLECDIARIANEDGNLVIGCRLLGENKDYQIYEFLKRLRLKYTKHILDDNNETESNTYSNDSDIIVKEDKCA